MTRLAVAALVAVLLAAAIALAAGAPAERAPSARAGVPAERVVARSARLAAGTGAVELVRVPRVGRLLVTCDDQRGPVVTLHADRLKATSDVVVDVGGGGTVATTLQPRGRYTAAPAAPAIAQTWHVAPFAAAGVRLSIIQVAARQVSERGTVRRCSASARASTSRSQGATRQR